MRFIANFPFLPGKLPSQHRHSFASRISSADQSIDPEVFQTVVTAMLFEREWLVRYRPDRIISAPGNVLGGCMPIK
ncbi:hypothetical protein [Burkholderia stabilis]